MSTKMPGSEDVRAFLDRSWPTMLGVVGTLRRDGAPHVVPVWYRYDGALRVVHIWTEEARGWVKNLRRDDRVAFSVQEDQPPFGAVVMQGRAEVVTSESEEARAEIRRITRRYVAEPEAESYIQVWAHLHTIVSIKPEKIVAWGKGY